MKNEQIITFEGDHIKAITNGEKDADSAARLFTSIRDTCVQHDCFDILGLANSTKHLSVGDGYNLAKLFTRLGITVKHRIAWVELNPATHEDLYFFETVLRNRGFRIKVFPTASEAKKWLLPETT